MKYENYRLNGFEWILGIVIYAAGDGAIAFFFYRSVYVFPILFIFFPLFILFYKKKLINKRKKKLLDEFSEVLYSVSISMKAGYSIENAFVEAYRDICLFYGKNSLMAEEIKRIEKGLEINITLEELIEDFAKRSGEKDIILFSEVCKSAKRNGGNTAEVLLNTADRIRRGIYVEKEIETILSEKKLEMRIMEVMPFFILGYLEVTSVGYFSVCYESISGRIFMTIALLVYIISILLGQRILRIEV